MKSIYELEKYDEVKRKSDGEVFIFKKTSSTGFAFIWVEDREGEEYRVYGPDYEPVQKHLSDRAEVYEVKQHHSFIALQKEINTLTTGIQKMMKEIDAIWESGTITPKAGKLADKISVARKQLKECETAIGWIMEKVN